MLCTCDEVFSGRISARSKRRGPPVLIALIAIPAVLAGIPKNCYQNFTAIRCGEQTVLNSEEYCKNINLTIDDCYTEGQNFTLIFSGIEYFKIPDDTARIVFSFYSRSWTWVGDQKDIPLPENSTIYEVNASQFMLISKIRDKKIESSQITVPFCYGQINHDKEKIYPRTQAGRICTIKTAELPEEPIIIKQQLNQTQAAEQKPSIDTNLLLLVLVAILVVIGIIVLRPRPKK